MIYKILYVYLLGAFILTLAFLLQHPGKGTEIPPIHATINGVQYTCNGDLVIGYFGQDGVFCDGLKISK